MEMLTDSIFMNAGVPVALVDASGRILESNLRLQRLTGFEKEPLHGKTVSDLLKPDAWHASANEAMTDMDNVDDVENVEDAEHDWSYVLQTAGAETLPVRIEEIPVGDAEEGKKLLFIFDCSEIQNLREDNLHMARLASLGKLLAGIIHEISNPLSIINGCAQLLNAKELPPEISDDIEHICSESRRTSDLVKRVLSFARKSEKCREKFSIQNVIEETVVLKHYSLKNNNIQLQLKPASHEPLNVFGYRNQLMQVFLNLINNSEQALSDSVGKGTIGLQIQKSRTDALVTVSDSGPGIDPKDRDRIFEAFFTTKKRNRGTGMGLYICRNIIRKHGGELRLIENNPGETAFQIQMPLWKEDTSEGVSAGSAGAT